VSEEKDSVNGKMLWFNATKGFGCICTEDEERLHVAISGFQPGEAPIGRCAGRDVVFDLVARSGDVQAVNVRFPADVTPRRARRRYGTRPR
jgi:cold shock CspA family protein